MKAIMIRDAATEIPALAFRPSEISAGSEWGRAVVTRAGFGREVEDHEGFLILVCLVPVIEAHYDPFSWDGVTMKAAHLMLADAGCFDSLPEQGGELDVEQYRLALVG